MQASHTQVPLPPTATNTNSKKTSMKATTDEALLDNDTEVLHINNSAAIGKTVAKSWQKIAPFWPLKNLIAVNPLAGFEEMPFEEGLAQANAYFQQQHIPAGMQHVNRESIKWLQVYFDQGQSTIQMPLRNKGFLKSTLTLAGFDKQLHQNNAQKIQWLAQLPHAPEDIITEALHYLGVKAADHELFLTLMLTTLPGWAAHIQYRTNWADAHDAQHPHPVTHAEYTAFRLVLTCLVWPQAKELVNWHKKALQAADVTSTCNSIAGNEAQYQQHLVKQLKGVQPPPQKTRAAAQLVFCIDVRSEPFRRAVEAAGNYETYGFAGFFGIPVTIGNPVTGEAYASCPVLLKPAYTVQQQPNCNHQSCNQGYSRLKGLKKLYQSLKYTFTTPSSLVETMGLASGLWMGLKSVTPSGASYLQSTAQKWVAPNYTVTPNITAIPFTQQVAFGAGALKLMGLTSNFAPLVVFCGHGSTTENNAYATALDCGACGGRHGAPNARILAAILNDEKVRNELRKQGIAITADTTFLAAEHNTTTDEVEIYSEQTTGSFASQLAALKKDLLVARDANCVWRGAELGVNTTAAKAQQVIGSRSIDWAQVRPEWGLAKNAAFIAAPRWLTKNTNLQGRSFLHSYEWEQDSDGSLLKTILTAPMVVAQWINAQYFFSTYDNVAFGGGSKITKNITGKIGIMQGNASDLMHGLPLQSVFASDEEAYHKPLRLTVVVYAPKERISQIIEQHEILQKLFGNGWIYMICHDPEEQKQYTLKRNLQWGLLQ